MDILVGLTLAIAVVGFVNTLSNRRDINRIKKVLKEKFDTDLDSYESKYGEAE
jgi:hypothetical protein